MENSSDHEDAPDGWQHPQPGQPEEEQQYVESSNQHGLANFTAQNLADSQFQQLHAAGSSFQVYQPQSSTSGYGRSSPGDNFASSSTGGENLQHVTTLTHDGQIIRIPQPLVTLLVGNQVAASSTVTSAEPSSSTSHAAALQSLQVQLQQLQAVQPASHSHQQQQQQQPVQQELDGQSNMVPGSFSLMPLSAEVQHVQIQAGQAVEQRPTSSAASSATITIPVTLNANQLGVVASSSNSSGSLTRHRVAVRNAASTSSTTQGPSSVVDSTVGAHLAAAHHSRGQHPSNSLFQVINGLPQLQHSEATSSEATPLSVEQQVDSREAAVNSISLALQQTIERAKQEMSDVYSTEPDTTQEDSQLQMNVHHHDEEDSYGRADSSHLDLDSSTAPALDSTISSAMDPSGLDGSIDDSNLNTPQNHNLDPTMDPQIDTTGIPATPQGPDEDGLQQMLVTITPVYHGEPSTNAAAHSGENKENEFLPGRGSKEVRKSSRLANLDRVVNPAAPRYLEKAYSPNELWCEECQVSYATECPTHRMQMIFDKVVLSRAWASLPPQLQIFRLGESSELGVFAKKPIPKRTQFGPYIADLVTSRDRIDGDQQLLLQVDRDDGVKYFDSKDENRCNWMMFVRPAQNWSEQNLIVYQFGVDLYFATIKPIEPKQELKVWYAAHYGQRLGVEIHQPSAKDREELEESANKWPCYECSKRFKTSALLQKHLAIHDSNRGFEDLDDSDNDVTVEFSKGKAGKYGKVKRMSASIKSEPKVGNPAVSMPDLEPVGVALLPSKLEELSDNVGSPAPSDGAESNTSQNWKRKKTSIYLNKYKKYRTEAVKKSIKSLYKKKGPTRTGANEWICTHCDLTFNNPSLLNLHTLTHAAEDIDMLDIQRLTVSTPEGQILEAPLLDTSNQVVLEGINQLTCPVCKTQFDSQQGLIQHVSEHGKTLSKRRAYNPNRPFRCTMCWKSFAEEEKLSKHMLCHGRDDAKPLECEICHKRFLNNSARACHMKTHSENKFYTCFVCGEGFDRVPAMKEHGKTHVDPDGLFRCKECGKEFKEYMPLRKHMRSFHGPTKYPCQHCDRVFPRPDKLKLHMLKHSSHREFMCHLCGRQFKRKDKLKEHGKRMHGPGREERLAQHKQKMFMRQQQQQQKFAPKVSPNDYHRFIYKCHACMLGFKRRGMLVNHLAKRHPDIKPEDVPELNLPILRTQRDYFCQYCDKVYKSSSKRKAHILKNHPGAQLPNSGNMVRKAEFVEPGVMSPNFSQTVGSVTTMPHQCEYCHKQYASRAKLMQHQRKVHPLMVPLANSHQNRPQNRPRVQPIAAAVPKTTVVITSIQPDGTETTQNVETDGTIHIQQAGSESLQATDLLTQAMSELTQSLGDYRPAATTEYQLSQRLISTTGNQTITAPLAQAVIPGHSTIDISQLGQALANSQQTIQQIQLPQASGSGATIQTLVAVPATMATGATNVTTAPIPVSVASTAFIPKSWTPTSTFTTFR